MSELSVAGIREKLAQNETVYREILNYENVLLFQRRVSSACAKSFRVTCKVYPTVCPVNHVAVFIVRVDRVDS